MGNQSADGTRGDEALSCRQTLPNSVARRLGGRRGLQLLTTNGRARPLLRWTVVLTVILPLERSLSDDFGGGTTLQLPRCGGLPYQCTLSTYFHFYKRGSRR